MPANPGAHSPVPAASPVIQKPIAPKKETTRIALPPDPKTMPKATVKLNQTVPMSAPMPTPAIRTADIATANEKTEEEIDPLMMPLSIVAFLAAAFAVATAFLVR